MPLVIGLGTKKPDWKDPLGLYGGKAPGLDPSSSIDTSASAATKPAVAAPKLSDTDRSDLVKTIIAEAAGEGPEGMAAVASVIKNRAQVRGKSPAEVVREPDQFTGYSKPGPDALKAMEDPEIRAQAESILDQVLGGSLPDPTGGADHYHATSVSPYWADKMPKTADIGNHRFYKSGRERKGGSLPSYDEMVAKQPGLGGNSEDPFDAVLKGDGGGVKHEVKGRGMADLLPDEPEQPATGKGGVLNFVHEGQDKLDPTFRGILEETSAEFGRPFTINSGFRGANHPVEARKKRPGQHSTGSASDISMKGMSEAERQDLVRSLMAKGVKRFGIYKNSPDMLHVDMKDQTGSGTPWFMYDRTNALMPKAPAWFQEVAANPSAAPGPKVPVPGKKPEGGTIVLDETFKPADGMNVFAAAGSNPFQQMAEEQRAAKAAADTERADQFEQTRIRALNEQHNRDVGALAGELEQQNPGRYQEIDESELPGWQSRWEEENRSGGLAGDTGKILKSGVIGLGQSLSSLADTVFSKIPGGEKFLQASDEIDRWVMGNTLDQKMANAQDTARASVTERQQEADAKNWWDEEKGFFGPAWSDPRSYLRAVGESAPSTVVTMLPGGILARGAYVRALAGGASQRAAAATAARTATLAGAITEGTLGGADSAKRVRDAIAAMPRDQVLQAEAVQDLIAGGMSEDEAIRAISEDAASQAFLVSGVATGMFGGMGDRALAKIIAEGVGGGVAKRILTGGLRGAVAEGILEEAPQGAAQTIAQNRALQTVDPDKELTEGVGEAVAGGIAAGGVMGGGMGAAGGAASRAPAPSQDAGAADPDVEFVTPPPRGPIGRSVRHAEQEIERRSPSVPVTADAPAVTPPADGRPEIGATVRIDAEGIEPFMGRIDGYEGDEAVVIDGGSGEVYQVPIANISEIAKSPATLERENPSDKGVVPVDDEIPALSNDPALEPQAPVAAEVKTEPLPPKKEQKPALERFPSAPEAGSRVIVDNDAVGRFPAKVKTWTEGGTEAVVEDDSGKEYQVPADDLYISKLTEKQIEQQELKRNPPVERETPEKTPTRRQIGERFVDLPDERHARLYDLARDRFVSKKTLGASHLDIDRVDTPELKKLADEFGVTTTALGAMADDYRYRVERAAKEARSKLPVKMHPVNERRLKQWQAERAKQEPGSAAKSEDLAQWWDVELTQVGRREILQRAGVKRPDRVMWQHLTPQIQRKLEAVRNESDSGIQQVDVPADQVDAAAIPDAAEAMAVDTAAHDAATSPQNDLPEPTQAQKEAGNYKVGRMRVAGLDLSIENPAGSERKGVDPNGKEWSVEMKSHYGYIRGTVGRDKDHIDTFVKPGTPDLDDSAPVFVVDQRSGNGRFDEHKVMIGFDSVEAARDAYMENYTAGWKGLGDITPTTMGEFKRWLKSGKTSEPFAPKWFGSRDKADAYVTKQGLAGTHEVVENGKRFEAREKAASAEAAPSRTPTDVKFQTSKGSRYVVNSDGTTTRDKAYRPEHGEKEQGPQPTSDATFYVDKEGLDKLGEFQTQGSKKAIVLDKGHAAVRYIDGPNAGGIESRTIAKVYDKPAVGLYPVELWKDGTRVHFGNEITSVGNTAEVIPETDRPAEQGKSTNNTFDDLDDLDDDISPELRAQKEELARLLSDKEIEDETFDHPGKPAGDLPAVRAAVPSLLAANAEKVKIRDLALHTEEQWAYALDADGTAYRMNASEHDAIGNVLSEAAGPGVAIVDVMPESGLALFRLSRGKKGLSGSLDLYSMPNAKQVAAIRQIRNVLGGEPGMFMIATHRPKGELLAGPPAPKQDAAEKVRASAKEKAPPKVQKKLDDAFAKNKLFTADKVEAARARLRSKMGQLNSGIDPEMLIDGMTIAGAYIEAGIRDFTDYAARMVDDFGDGIKPYLLAYWEGARNYPGLDTQGMTSPDESQKLHASLNRELPASEAAPLGAEIAPPKKKTARKGRSEDRLLEGDYGVEHIDAYSDEGEAAKETFLKDAAAYLRAVSQKLVEMGYTNQVDRKGKPMKTVSTNEAGIAVSGEVSMTMKHIDTGMNVYANIQGSSLRGVVPTSPSGVSIMFRASADDIYGARGQNMWAPLNLTAGQLAEAMDKAARNALARDEFKRQAMAVPEKEGDRDEPAELDRDGPEALEGAPSDAVPGTETGRDAGSGAERRGRADVSRGERARGERVQSGRGVADDAGDVPAATSRRERAEGDLFDQPRRDEGRGGRAEDDAGPVNDAEPSYRQLRNVESVATPAQQRPADFTITDADRLGEGGQKSKFNANIKAIKLLRTLDEEKRPATRDEQAVLAQWVGWGGLRQAFYREDGSVAQGWEKQAAELKALLTPEEYSAAESSTRNAHYTSPQIVTAVWDIARRLGFRGGQVLEPSVGAGNFLGLMPGDVRDAARVTGVELDRITGNIAKNLYPGANIQAPMGFEKLTVPNDYFDLAIGNPPFGSEKVYDKERRHLNKLSIHNFFFAKSMEAVRPGGVLAMVVTNRFLDGTSVAAREMIAKQADLVAAIRLPNNAFLKNAGTEVTTDIVILRKRMPGEAPSGNWTEVGEWKGRDGKTVPLNRYFIDNPDMLLGDFGAFGSMYGPDEPALVAREGQDLPADLAKAIRALPENIMVEPGTVATETVTVPETVADVQVGAMFAAPDGTVHERLPDSLGKTQSKVVDFPNETAKERVGGMIRVRDAFARLRRAQIDDTASDAQIENLRKRLNTVYDGFVKKHGPINADANKRLFRDDPTWPQIAALEENFDKGISAAVAKTTGEKARAPSASKAPIFTKRTQQPYRRPTSATSAKDALATVLNDYGRVNLDAMSRLYGKPPQAIVEELGPLLFKTPAGNYETADAYLSGNVKKKLAEAERAAEDDSDFRRNVNALRDVIPADIDAVDIDVKPGSPWVPAKHVEDFIQKIAESAARPKAFYSSANAKWVVDVPTGTPAAQTLWGTDRATVGTVLSAVLNGQSITIYDRHSDGSSTLNEAATAAANEKAERVKAEWRRWIWEDDARRDELARLYNDTFNTDVQRVYDGSHLTLPGKVGDDIITLRPHQKNFIWRTLQSGTALADHTVGAGKTFAAIASIMEKRRTGQARKPMLAVPNHLVGQWAADFIRLYPGAKVLAATKRDFEKQNRKQLFARVATGDWDVVIVAHSSFGKIGMNPEYEAAFIAQQMEDLEASIEELRRETGQKSRNVAQLTKWRDNLKAKMERLLDAGKKDDGLTFDELGVDALYVDEFHEFKNLPFATGMQRVAGLGNPAGSQKATDMYMKIQFVLEKTGGNNVVTLTGTPLSNTMAEMYTVQRYLDGKTLRDLGVAHFDAWARVFGEVVTDWELSPSGQYKLNSRFAKFVNMPELMQRYLAFADVITNDDIKAQLAAIGKKLPLPKVKGGKPTNITVERSRDQATYIGEGTSDEHGNLVFPKGSLVWRAENLPKKAEKGADNMLKVMSDARKAALDMRLIDPSYPDDPGSKVNRAADEMKRIYDQWSEKRGTQLVFIDLSTPKKAKAREEAELRELIRRADEGDEAAQEKLDNMSPDDFLALQSTFSVYDDLREKLLAKGIPAEEIAFIHDANTEAQKEELFGKVRSGRVRFLFGSTPKMGAGTNVQNRLVALHHLDAPWRPSDLEQRDGRGIRQGNELYAEDPDGFEIEILRYATKNTLDARQWQGIEAKARFIQQVRKGNLKTREIEDIAGEAANAAEMKAAASGNPLILEEMETRRKLRTLESQSIEHDREQHRIKSRIRGLNDEIARLEQRAPAVAADAAKAEALAGQDFAATFGGQTFDKQKEFGAALIAAMRKELIDRTGELPSGKFGDFTLSIAHQYERSFDVTIEGDREHHVNVMDAADVDPTGLAMRVINTVKKLATYPAMDQERITEARGQIPALEKQIGEWANAKELEETAVRHRKIVDALKPKKPGEKTTAVVDGADAPVANKRPDPVVTSADGRLRSLPVPERPEGKHIHAWARDHLTEIGNRTGHEYLIAVDDDGSVVEYGTAGAANYTGMNNKLGGALQNPDRRLVVFHNHPRNTALSMEDISVLASPGLHAVWAIGSKGHDTRASLSQAAAEKIAERREKGRLTVFLADLRQARDAVQAWLTTQQNLNRLEPSEASLAFDNLATLLADRAGIIDFYDNSPYDPSLIPGLTRQIDEAALKLARTFFNDSSATLRAEGLHRPSQSVRHVAELEGMGEGGERLAGTRSGPAGLSEGSAASYSPEDGGRRVTESRIIGEIRGRLTDLTPAVLKTIPLNYFPELARPNMTAVTDYLRVKRLMDAFRGQKHADADAVAGEWLKYARLGFAGKDKAKAAELADLMHDSTLAGIDPSLTDEETQAKPGYDALRRRFVAMSPKGRELYIKVRDAYATQQKELDEILLDNVRKAQEIALARADERYKREMQRIKDRGLTGIDRRNAEEDAASAHKAETTKARWAAKARMTKMRIAFENSRVEAPYFPLGRFGRYFVTVRDVDGAVLTFSKFERAADRDRFAADMRRSFPGGKVEVGVMEQGSDLRRAMDPRIVAEIEEILGGAGVDGSLLDMIWQRYLESMPDLSARKRFIHRKGTAGFTQDALRVFSSHMFHSAHQMARLKYGLELQELVDQTFDQAKESDDQTRAMTLANELSKRHEWVMNPTGGKAAQTMTSAAFVWFLASSPAAAAVNMTQTVMMGLPILAGRFGSMTKAAAALGQASIDSVFGKGTVTKASLSKDERRAMEAFYQSGLIDRTQSHDLAGVGDTGVEYSPLRARVMGLMSWAFHKAEIWNREVTALAAYRMAREAGANESQAIDMAHELTWKTHFDYSNSSRPAVMQNDFAKVALVFRSHQINMLYRMGRDIHLSLKGETKQAKREARYQLAGVVGMQALMAGVTGVAGFNLAMSVLGMIFGDEDDPLEFGERFKADVVDILGPELGGIILNGAPGHYLGVDLTSRIGLPDLWFRSPTRELQGKEEYQYWLSQVGGATVGLGENLFRGISLMTEGEVARGIEISSPKFIRDLIKTYRYASEGLNTIGGDTMMTAEQIGWHGLVAQGIGFTPAAVAETWDRNSALKNAERRILDERQRLVNKWGMAAMEGDKDGMKDAVDAIRNFNASERSRGVPIKKETLQRSIKTRAANAAKREDGVLIRNQVLSQRLREALSERIYE